MERAAHDSVCFPLADDLRSVVTEEQLRLHCQPIVDMQTMEIAGFEVLVRWQHPRLGLLYPERFISLAAETGAIEPLTRWVLKEACRGLADWIQREDGSPDWFVSVNVEAQQLMDAATVVQDVSDALDTAGLAPNNVKLELAERARFDPAAVRPALDQLRGMGVSVVLDDFGTGFASLYCLKELPLDGVKLDRLFLRDVPACRRDVKMLRTIVKGMHEVGLGVTVEGVETAAQAAVVQELACFGQGFYFSRPQAAEEMRNFLSAWAEGRAAESRRGFGWAGAR